MEALSSALARTLAVTLVDGLASICAGGLEPLCEDSARTVDCI